MDGGYSLICLANAHDQWPQSLSSCASTGLGLWASRRLPSYFIYRPDLYRWVIIHIIDKMTEMSKFINLLIEYGEKLEHLVHKKYRPFIASVINLKELAKNVNPQKIILTRELIVFKIGVESKSTKCVELSLTYLHKLLALNFIDLSQPNFCEEYLILDGKVEHRQVEHHER